MSVLDHMEASRRRAKSSLEILALRIEAATASEARSLRVKFDAGLVRVAEIDARIEQLQEVEIREAATATTYRETGPFPTTTLGEVPHVQFHD